MEVVPRCKLAVREMLVVVGLLVGHNLELFVGGSESGFALLVGHSLEWFVGGSEFGMVCWWVRIGNWLLVESESGTGLLVGQNLEWFVGGSEFGMVCWWVRIW